MTGPRALTARASVLAPAALCAAPAAALPIPTTGNPSGPRFPWWVGVIAFVVVMDLAGRIDAALEAEAGAGGRRAAQ